MKVSLSSINFSRYELYSDGRIFSLISNRFLKPFKDSQGYLYVEMSNDQRCMKKFSVHRLVATTFIPNPDNLPEVNHKYGDKSDNSYQSLEWVSSSQNSLHAERTGLRNNGHIDIKLIEYICKDIINGLSNKEIAIKYSIKISSVSSIKCGKSYKDISANYLNFSDYKCKNLTDDQVKGICRMLASNHSYKEIADNFNTNIRRVSEIKNRKSFLHITKDFEF